MTVDKSKKLLTKLNLWIFKRLQISRISHYLKFEIDYWLTWFSLVSFMNYQTLLRLLIQALGEFPRQYINF
ncbi:hypothetical protein NIES4101_89170 [Calothrix sp. NIES-4101]|nr:hypothetical protein NIES4101_89170 [Calothrix sp. NIES-4101]